MPTTSVGMAPDKTGCSGKEMLLLATPQQLFELRLQFRPAQLRV